MITPGRCPPVKFSREAVAQVEALRRHYLEKGRPEAARNLTAALRAATRQIIAGKSFPAPRPYPELAREGEAWTHAGRYWIAHTTAKPFEILAVFYDAADIPRRR
jgi:plasmid stabilization system protein ParE